MSSQDFTELALSAETEGLGKSEDTLDFLRDPGTWTERSLLG